MAEPISRRSFLRGLALGGAVIAGELWIPGAKVISIPKTLDVLKYKTSERYLYTEELGKSIGQIYAEALAKSLMQTRWRVSARVLNENFGG